MELTVLGSASPYARPGNPCSGYLVRHGGTALWMDAGPGTLAELQRHVRPDRLDGIWISHLHADHVSDLLTAYYALLYADLEPSGPIPLYGPPGTADRLRHFLSNQGPSPVEDAFDMRELYDGRTDRVGELTVESRAVEHGFPAFGARIGTGGRAEAGPGVLAYSGDTGPCPALEELAEGASLLLCEADLDAPADGEAVHLTPEQAGESARKAGVGRLVLTHVGPSLRPEDAVVRAQAAFGGPTSYAAPGEAFSAS
ncbi:MBL fold metallo-hydrolase [Nocardiopsis chromatogenes]|uniref:MBL fold metallo-hydrolase n=1 Tax=Nocardiopsis chromatogenes TaxID=280239 RepID=UPI00034D5816|nr:MBL fold metallo-hydrolase [Nocardiopsis chromatogenes]